MCRKFVFHCNLCALSEERVTPLWAELWALRLGIKLARQLQLTNVAFEMDSLTVVNMVNSGGTENANFRPILKDILIS